MGKKQKGRRQILQLESKKPSKITSKQMKNIIHYSDSDDDSKKSSESDPSLFVPSKEVCPLDTQVEDFFKEIDALTVNEECIEAKGNTTPLENEIEKNISKDVSNEALQSETKAVSITNKSESAAYSSWQEIQDESTGYSYYWNVETNEVTWDCPEEFATFVKNVNFTHSNTSLSQNEEKNEPNLRKSQIKKSYHCEQEGSIIPISYFGESSSSDELNSSDEMVKKSQLKKKKSERARNKSKLEVQSEAPYDIIGPQLPPDFQFPKIEDCDEISLTLNASNETAEYVETNSFLNQKNNSILDSKTCSFNVLNLSPLPDHLDSIATSSSQNKEENFNKESNISNISKDTGKESPDTAMKPGIGLVVEYDSFTDEDEEVSTSEPCVKETSSNNLFLTVRTQNQEKANIVKKEFLNELDSTKNIFAGIKRKNCEMDSESSEISGEKRSKKIMSSYSLDIDNLFASYVSNQKHGFGFKMQEDKFEVSKVTNTIDSNINVTLNRKNAFKSVSFIKSDQIFNPKDLCLSTFLETDQPMTEKSPERFQIEEQFEKEEKVFPEQTALESRNIEFTKNDKKDQTSEILSKNLLKPCSSENTASLALEEDIDEVDKALCEALEAKKTMEKKTIIPCSDFPFLEEKESNDGFIESASDDNDSSHSNKIQPIQETDKVKVLNLSSDLVDKLTFIVSNHSTLTSLSTLLIQVQTRLVDWQASALETKYFMTHLQEVNNYIYQYETSVVSGDWICQWDRENKRYFYTNSKTNLSQWTYPEDLRKDSLSESSQHEAQSSSAAANLVSIDRDQPPLVSSSIPEMPLTNKISETLKDKKNDHNSLPSNCSSPPPPPPGVDSPPPPPPCSSPPSQSSPPIPPDSVDTTCDQPEDMDLENSNDSCFHPIISNTTLYEANQIHYSSMLSCSSNHLLNNYVNNSVASINSTFKTINEDLSLIPRSQHALPNSSSVNKTHVLWSGPQTSCSRDFLKDLKNQTSVNISVNSQPSDSSVDSCPSSSKGVHHRSSEDIINKTNVSTTNPPVKKEKKKTKLQSVLALKKKNIPSLVEKWQKIRKEQEEEDQSDHS